MCYTPKSIKPVKHSYKVNGTTLLKKTRKSLPFNSTAKHRQMVTNAAPLGDKKKETQNEKRRESKGYPNPPQAAKIARRRSPHPEIPGKKGQRKKNQPFKDTACSGVYKGGARTGSDHPYHDTGSKRVQVMKRMA